MDNKKKIVKLAVIRDPKDRVCPFGLFVPDACKCAGEKVLQMTPLLTLDDTAKSNDIQLEKDPETIKEAVKSNRSILMWDDARPAPCVFCNAVFDEKQKVECSFGDKAAGMGHADFMSFPSYTQYFSMGYSAVPVGFYSDHPSRNQIGNLESMVSGTFAEDESNDEKIKK